MVGCSSWTHEFWFWCNQRAQVYVVIQKQGGGKQGGASQNVSLYVSWHIWCILLQKSCCFIIFHPRGKMIPQLFLVSSYHYHEQPTIIYIYTHPRSWQKNATMIYKPQTIICWLQSWFCGLSIKRSIEINLTYYKHLGMLPSYPISDFLPFILLLQAFSEFWKCKMSALPSSVNRFSDYLSVWRALATASAPGGASQYTITYIMSDHILMK